MKVNKWGGHFKQLPSADLTILAGENGSGKSSYLRSLAEWVRPECDVLAISGTVYDRFHGLRLRSDHIYPGKKGRDASGLMKLAIRDSLVGDEFKIRYVSRILRHCGYHPDVGVEFVRSASWVGVDNDVLDDLGLAKSDLEDLVSVIYMVQSRWDKGRVIWVNFDSPHAFIYDADMVIGVFRWESVLLKIGVLSKVRVYIKSERGPIPLMNASSGELSLISNLVFISSKCSDYDYILIDEPENSLHPRWQRDYIDLLMAAVGYSNAKVVIATHSPLLVLSAGERRMDVDVVVFSGVFEDGEDLDSAGLEEIMAKVFHTFTPRNNYLSRSLAEMVDSVFRGELTKGEALLKVNEIRESGVDDRQERALDAVVKMIGEAG